MSPVHLVHQAAIECEDYVVALRRKLKRFVRPMLGFKSFRSARILIAGIETMHMIRKAHFECPQDQASSAANQFYSLAF